jgi:hypothetical protein
MAERRVVSRDEYLSAASKVVKEDVPVPELGEGAVVPVWQMTSRELTQFELSCTKANEASVRERYLVAVCKDDNGVALFTSDDIATLAKSNVAMIDRVTQVARRLNTVTQSQLEDAKKNSGETTD